MNQIIEFNPSRDLEISHRGAFYDPRSIYLVRHLLTGRDECSEPQILNDEVGYDRLNATLRYYSRQCTNLARFCWVNSFIFTLYFHALFLRFIFMLYFYALFSCFILT